MIKKGLHYATAPQFNQFYKNHPNILPKEEHLSNYKVKKSFKALASLHEEYAAYLFRDKNECHFRDFLHWTGNYQYIPLLEVLSAKGVRLSHSPDSYFIFNKEELLGGDDVCVSYDEWRRRRSRTVNSSPSKVLSWEDITGMK
jgi:hypothetical protein